MNKDIIPLNVLNILKENPNIGRTELSAQTNIPVSEARNYCWLYKKLHGKKQAVKKGVVLFDIHYPDHDHNCMKIALKFIEDFQPDIFVLGGDQLDMNTISSWSKKKPKLTENKRLKQEYRGFQKHMLDKFALPDKCRKIWLTGNHCLSEDTELLTQRGWITHNNIKVDDKVLSYGVNKLEWVNIDDVMKYDYNKQLKHFQGSHMDLLATTDHNVFHLGKHNEQRFIPFGDLTDSRYKIPISGSFNLPEYNLSDDKIRLIAWLLTDGHIQKKYGYVTFYQAEKKKHLIENLLNKENIEYKLRRRYRKINSIHGKTLKSCQVQYEISLNTVESKKLTSHISIDKSIPSWVEKLSNRQFNIFIDSLIDGDGSRHKSAPETSLMLYGKKAFLDAIQVLCIQHNYRASLFEYREGDYRLNITQRNFYYLSRGKDTAEVSYEGIVWDLTVKNHNFMVRRNGKAFFTGNCQRVQWLIESEPQFEGFIEPENNLDLSDWELHKFGDVIQIGEMLIAHGKNYNMHHAKKNVLTYGTNIFTGHAHTNQIYTTQSPTQQLPRQGVSVGCLCNKNPDYLAGQPSRWINQFLVFWIFSDGSFAYETPTIINGNAIICGKHYFIEGKKCKSATV